MHRVSKFLLVLSVLLLAGCQTTQSAPPEPELSQVELRQLQTREFKETKQINGMKAVSAALQDEGFTISQANNEMGLITAQKQISEEDTGSKSWQQFWYGVALNYQTAREIDATVNVNVIDSKLRVRISLVSKALSNQGGVITAEPVADPEIYQLLFSKIDKSVFLSKNNM